MRGAEQITQMEQRRRASAAPWVTAPTTTGRGEEQDVSLRQFIRLCGIDVDTGLVGCQQQRSKPQPPHNGIRMVRSRRIRQPYGSRQQPTPLCGKNQSLAFAMVFDKLHRQQVRELCLADDPQQLGGRDILAPSQQPQRLDLTHTKNHSHPHSCERRKHPYTVPV